MKKLVIVLLLLPILSFAQSKKDVFVKMEIKPIDAKKGYTFEVYKTEDEIKIDYKKIDSVRKFSFSDEDKKIISRLIEKTDIDSMSKDPLDYYQSKLEAIKESNTFYQQESMSIYRTTHKSYFKFLEEVIKIPDSILVEPQTKETISANTYCFFTITEGIGKEKRTFYIECLEPKIYPILTKLVNDTDAIVKAYKTAKERKN